MNDQELQGFEPNDREDVFMFYAFALQSLQYFYQTQVWSFPTQVSRLTSEVRRGTHLGSGTRGRWWAQIISARQMLKDDFTVSHSLMLLYLISSKSKK